MRRAPWLLLVLGCLGAECVGPPAPAPPAGVTITCGPDPRQFFQMLCASCHALEPGEPSYARPVRGTYGRWLPQVNGPHRLVDEEFIRESIFEPHVTVTYGFAPAMPTFEGQLKEDHIAAIVELYRAMR